MGTTPIYNLAYPDITDNVADGATAMQTLATDIEDMFDVYGGMKKIVPSPTGHTNITFNSRGNGTIPVSTGALSITMVNVFSSAFNAYRVHWLGAQVTVSNVSPTLSFPNITTGVYQNCMIYMFAGDATVYGTNSVNGTSANNIGRIQNTTPSFMVVDIFNPAQSTRKAIKSLNVGTNGIFGVGYCLVDSTTVATDLRISMGLGPRTLNPTGTVCIYGYNV